MSKYEAVIHYVRKYLIAKNKKVLMIYEFQCISPFYLLLYHTTGNYAKVSKTKNQYKNTGFL